MDGYRTRFYENYATLGSARAVSDDPRPRKAFDYYLRGWLPPSGQAQILDVGCGSGALLSYLRGLGYTNVEGIDVSPEQVALAIHAGLHVTQHEALGYLAGHRGEFDAIFAIDVIEHLPKSETIDLLEYCREALRPGGRLVLQTPNGDSPFAGAVMYGDFTHEAFFSPRSLAQSLVLAGFSDVRLREEDPIPWGYSVSSSARFAIWKAMRAGLIARNYVETGSPGSGVFTRVFLASAVRS